jgi:hypothetical protein
MNVQEREIAQRIVRELDRSSLSIDKDTAARLLAAREQALAQYQQAPVSGMAGAGAFVSHVFERPASGARYALSLAVLILGLAGIDARLLTDDLPIDAYLDKGFDSWLNRQSR